GGFHAIFRRVRRKRRHRREPPRGKLPRARDDGGTERAVSIEAQRTWAPAYLSALGMTCAAGDGLAEIILNLRKGVSPGMAASDHWTPGIPLTVGQVSA